jgi:type I restriction enzyme M protein
MKNLLEEGLERGLIRFDEDKNFITYVHQNKKRNFTNPEEKVQANAFLALVLRYNYPVKRVKNFVPVKMGADSKEADIVVYSDDKCEQPHILVECKKQEVSEQEFLQAVEQAYSYAYALPNDVKYVWITSELKSEYFEVDKKKSTRVSQSDIPQFGVKKLATYRYVYEAASLEQKEGQQRFFDLSVIDEAELTRRFKQAHDALWAGGQLNPSEAFDELDKLIFCKIWDERKDRKAGDPYDFQIIVVHKEEVENWENLNKDDLAKTTRSLENQRLLERVKKLYEEGRKKDPEVFRDNIRLSAEKVRTVVGYLESVNLSDTDLDSKGRAFETFMDSFFRGNFGQYFTPRPIVKFTTEVLPITNESLVLDTSCGSGGFLLYALNKVREQANELYQNHKKDQKQNQRHYKFWHDFAEKNLYGIEINEQISRAAKMNMIIHDDGHTNVISADGLLPTSEIEKLTKNTGFKCNHFDFIITNPPFGSSIKSSEKKYLETYKFGKKEADWLNLKSSTKEELRDSQSTEILFIEQCHKFLKEGGYLAIVIPDGILTNSSLQYVRDTIEEFYRIVAVVSMPQTAFAANGAGVKSSVIFLRKHKTSTTEKIANQKLYLKEKLKREVGFEKACEDLEKEKSQQIKALETAAKSKNPKAEKKQISELIKEEKEKIQTDFTNKINALKEELSEKYLETKRRTLDDYQIFMAIAEDIGYDTTGRQTGKNELPEISQELSRFIEQINNGEC